MSDKHRWILAELASKAEPPIRAAITVDARSAEDQRIRMIAAVGLSIIGAIGSELKVRTGFSIANLPQPLDSAHLIRERSLETLAALDRLLNRFPAVPCVGGPLDKEWRMPMQRYMTLERMNEHEVTETHHTANPCHYVRESVIGSYHFDAAASCFVWTPREGT